MKKNKQKKYLEIYDEFYDLVGALQKCTPYEEDVETVLSELYKAHKKAKNLY